MIREGDELGMTPLHYAAFYGKIEAIKLFLEYDSCAIYLLTNNGASALHIAAFQGHINALEELINCRPDCCNLVDNKGRTPLHAAVLGRQGAAVEFMLGKRKFKKLMNKQDYGGNTALHLIYIHKAFSVVVTCLQFNTLVQRSGKILNNEFSTPKDISLKLRGLGMRIKKLGGSHHLISITTIWIFEVSIAKVFGETVEVWVDSESLFQEYTVAEFQLLLLQLCSQLLHLGMVGLNAANELVVTLHELELLLLQALHNGVGAP
ncbi:ankyrin repeat-containing protein At2g01680-like [Momordica charantia]|uniref:Ankyrin repeat-containing protein At2g01680-like n=1 Tax=Momordica charantia TaxID=3673 RepID=A0A6J1CPJ8_MOMCH|nr:ankyrin repeat-containing protein At2g01680-like [Momordica charantia]